MFPSYGGLASSTNSRFSFGTNAALHVQDHRIVHFATQPFQDIRGLALHIPIYHRRRRLFFILGIEFNAIFNKHLSINIRMPDNVILAPRLLSDYIDFRRKKILFIILKKSTTEYAINLADRFYNFVELVVTLSRIIMFNSRIQICLTR